MKLEYFSEIFFEIFPADKCHNIQSEITFQDKHWIDILKINSYLHKNLNIKYSIPTKSKVDGSFWGLWMHIVSFWFEPHNTLMLKVQQLHLSVSLMVFGRCVLRVKNESKKTKKGPLFHCHTFC